MTQPHYAVEAICNTLKFVLLFLYDIEMYEQTCALSLNNVFTFH